jgi:hypothetical protein
MKIKRIVHGERGSMRKLLVLATSVAVLGSAAGVAIADPNLVLTTTPHRHFINGVQVGPRLCDDLTNPGLQRAFTQFHANVHTHAGVTGEIGPQPNPAPGLHGGPGPVITSGAC